MGSIFKRERSPFWWIKFYDNGRPKYESTGIPAGKDTKGAARRILLGKELEVARRGGGQRRTVRELTQNLGLADLEKTILAEYKFNGYRSTGNVGDAFKNLIEYFDEALVADISETDLVAYKYHRASKGAKPATIYRDLRVLHRAMVLAKVNLPEFPPMPRLKNARQGFFYLHEFDRFAQHLAPSTRGIFTFTYLTGWRISEGCSREWRHVDFEEGFVRLERDAAKEKSDRVFPFAVLPELEE